MLKLSPLIALAGSLLLAVSVSADCQPSGQCWCDDPKNTCTTTNGRVTWNSTTPLGTPSVPALDHSQLTQGCYCQLAQASCSYGSSGCDRDRWGQYTYATSCTPDYTSWWDGANAINRTSDLGGYYDANGESLVSLSVFMWCDRKLGSGSLEVPSPENVTYVDWPTAPQDPPEVSLPENVAVYDGSTCPGADVNDGFFPNTKQVDAPVSNTLQNCTCQVMTLAGIDDAGDGEPLNGNSFQTVCGPNYNVFWCGKGWRSVRSAVNVQNSAVSDDCSYPADSAAVDLVYVKDSQQNAKMPMAHNVAHGKHGALTMGGLGASMLLVAQLTL